MVLKTKKGQGKVPGKREEREGVNFSRCQAPFFGREEQQTLYFLSLRPKDGYH